MFHCVTVSAVCFETVKLTREKDSERQLVKEIRDTDGYDKIVCRVSMCV